MNASLHSLVLEHTTDSMSGRRRHGGHCPCGWRYLIVAPRRAIVREAYRRHVEESLREGEVGA